MTLEGLRWSVLGERNQCVKAVRENQLQECCKGHDEITGLWLRVWILF